MASLLKNLLGDQTYKEVFGTYNRAASTLGSAANNLVGKDINDEFEKEFTEFVKQLGSAGYNVTPKYDKARNTLELAVTDAKSNQAAKTPLRIALSDKTGFRNIAGRMVRDEWVAYNEGGKGKITDSVIWELKAINSKLRNPKTAAGQALKSGEINALVSKMVRAQRDANTQVTERSKRDQKAIEEALREAVTADANRSIYDSGVVNFSEVFKAIALNKNKKFGSKMFGEKSLGRDYQKRYAGIQKDVMSIFARFRVDPKNAAKYIENNSDFKKRYGPDGIKAIVSFIEPFVALPMDVTNISHGSYLGGRVGTVSANQAGHYFAAPSNVHFKQVGNYNKRQKKIRDDENWKRLAQIQRLATRRQRGFGRFDENATEAQLYSYLEISAEKYSEAAADYYNVALQKDVEKRIKEEEAKTGRKLTTKEAAPLRAAAEAATKKLFSKVGMFDIGEDSYAVTKSFMHTLDDFQEKNITVSQAEINKRREKMEKAQGRELSDAEVIRSILASKISKKADFGRKKAAKMVDLDSIIEDERAEKTIITKGADGKEVETKLRNFTYNLNRQARIHDKTLWGQGDRATTVEADEMMIAAAALRAGVDPTLIGDFSGEEDTSLSDATQRMLSRFKAGTLKIAGVRTRRSLNARNFEEWFLPRLNFIANRAYNTEDRNGSLGGQFVHDFNAVIKEATGRDGFFSFNSKKGRMTREYRGGFTDLLDEEFGRGTSKEKKKALSRILSGFSKLFRSPQYGYFGKDTDDLIKVGKNGEFLVNEALDSSIPLLASANLIGKDWYGKPSVSGEVYFNKRGEYALKRAIGSAESVSGSNLSEYQTAMTKQLARRNISMEEWDRQAKEYERSITLSSNGSALSDGAKHYTLEELSKLDARPYDNALDGAIAQSSFEGTPLGQIWKDAQEYKKSHNGSLEGFEAVVDLPQAFAIAGKNNKFYSGNRIVLPHTSFADIGTRTENGVPLMTGIPSYFAELNRLLQDAKDAMNDDDHPQSYNDLIYDFYKRMHDDIYDKDGSTYRDSARTRWGRSGYVAATRENDRLHYYKDLVSDAGLFDEISSTGMLLSDNDVRRMFGSPSKKGKTKEQYREDLQAFAWSLEEQKDRMYADASDEIKQEIDEALKKNETKEIVQKNGAKKKRTEEQILNKRIDILRDYLLKGATLEDSKYFQRGKGLYVKGFRNPLTGGNDIVDTTAYLSSKMTSGRHGFIGRGLGWPINLDFDGDQFAAMLPFFEEGLRGLDRQGVKRLYDQQQILVDMSKRRAQFVAKMSADEAAKPEDPKKGQADKLLDSYGLTIAEFASQGNFQKTGVLDNYRQRLAYNLTRVLADEIGGDPSKIVTSLLSRKVFESLSQDAISAKKVADRYNPESKLTPLEAYDQFVGELDDLTTKITSGNKFVNEESIGAFIKEITGMGILDEQAGLNKRYTADIMSMIGGRADLRKAFIEDYFEKQGKGYKLDDTTKGLLTNTLKTDEYDFYKMLTEIGAKASGVDPKKYDLLNPTVLITSLLNANTILKEGEDSGKLYLGSKPGIALGRGVIYSADMPGYDREDKTGSLSKLLGEDGELASISDPMQKAADTLLLAANALLKLAGKDAVVAAGGGGGGSGKKKLSDILSSDDPEAAFRGNETYAASQLSRILRPGRIGTDASGFLDTILGNHGKDTVLGYKNEAALAEGFRSWWNTIRGTQTGNIAEMLMDAEKFGVKIRGKDGELLPLQLARRNIERGIFSGDKPTGKSLAAFEAWRTQLGAEGHSGTDKSFLQQYDTFAKVLKIIGDERLNKYVGTDAAGIKDSIWEDSLQALAQEEASYKGLRLGPEGLNVANVERLGTEVGLKMSPAKGINLRTILDSFALVTSEQGKTKNLDGEVDDIVRKGFATFDLKRYSNGLPSEGTMLQSIVNKIVLDDLTKVVQEAWKKGDDNAEVAYGEWKKSAYADQLKWSKETFAKTQGINTEATIGQSMITGQHGEGQSYILGTYGAYARALENYVLEALKNKEPLDDLTMKTIEGSFKRLSDGTSLSLLEGTESDEKAQRHLAEYGLGYASRQSKMLDKQRQIDYNQKLLGSGLLDPDEASILTDKTAKLKDEYAELTKKLRQYREEMGKTIGDEEKMVEAEKLVAEGVNQSKEAYEKANEARVNQYRDKKKKKDSKDYEQLLNEYNKLVVSYESDELAKDKSTNSLEKRALSMRMKDVGDNIKEIEEAIQTKRQDLEDRYGKEFADKTIADLEDKSAKRLKLMEDTMKVRSKGITNIWDSLATSFKSVFTRFSQMGLAYSILSKLKKGFSELVQSVTQLDKAMVNLRVVTGASYEEAKSMIHGYAQLGSELAATTLEVSTAAQEWLRQGYDVAEVNKLVESSIKLSVLGMMSASDATKSLTSAMKGFKLEAGDVSEIVDKFTSLDMKAATTAGDIATALSKFATTAQMAGVDIDQAAAMATAIMDVSQNDAGATGNALKTIFSRFGNVKAGTYQNLTAGDSDDTTDKINDIERVLSTLGIQVRSSAREMRDFDDVLDDIAEKWQYLDSVSQNAIATALAGTRQRESFAVLMNNYDKYKEFVEVSENSAGTADEKYQSYLEQLEASQKKLKAAWEDIANSTEIAGFMTKTNNFLSGVVSVLPTIIKYVTRLFITLNSYKIPKLLNNFLGIGDKGLLEGIKGKFHSLTAAGYQEKVERYNSKESKGFLDTIYGPARRVAEAFDAVAQSAERVVSGDVKKAEVSQQVSSIGEKEAAARQQETGITYDVLQAKDGEAQAIGVFASTAYTAADADLTEANASWAAARADAAESGDLAFTSSIPVNVMGKKSKFAPLKQGVGMAATGALTSVFMGAMMGSQGMNYSTGQMQDASQGANIAATATSALSNIGYLWGPLAGMITTTLGDVLNKYVVIPLIDREANERKARVEQANKLYEQVSGLADNVTSLTDYAKESALSGEDTKEMTDKVYELLSEYYNMDSEARSDIEEYLIPYLKNVGFENLDTIYDALKEYMKGDSDTRDIIAKALQFSITATEADLDLAKNENKDFETAQKLKELTQTTTRGDQTHGYYTSEETVPEWVVALTHLFGNTDTDLRSFSNTYVDANKLSYDLHEYLEEIKNTLNNLDKKDTEAIAYYENLKKQVGDLAAIRKQEMDAYNKQVTASAVLVSTLTDSDGDKAEDYLLNQNIDQLKYLGSDEIMRLIAEQIDNNGGFKGKSIYINNNSKNGLTDYAKEIIQQVIRSSPELAAAVSGSAYSLRDLQKNNGVFNWDNRQEEYENLVSSFSSALHMTQDEFIERLEQGDLVERLGSMTLGDFLKTPEELRQSMEDLSSLFQSLSNDALLTAENLEKVINNYPQYIQYLGDTSSLLEAMVKGFSEYAQVYATKIYDQLISSSEYAEKLKTNLYESGEYDTEKLRAAIGGATTVKGIIEELKKGPEVLKLSSDDYNKLTETFAHLFDKIDVGQIFMRQLATDTVIPYLDARLDKELEALSKQKEALQQINKQREYENKLIEARNKLEDAGKEKTRVWREGVGWVYEANQEAIAEAQKNLQEVEDDRQIRELDIMIDQINADKELLKAIQDDAKFKALETAMTSLLGDGAGNAGINGLINTAKKLYEGDDSVASVLGKTGETLVELKTELSTLLEKQFNVDYSSNEYSAARLKEIAGNSSLSDEVRQKASEELERRGYSGDSSQGWTYKLPESGASVKQSDIDVKQSDIDKAIEAYDAAKNQDEIETWLKDKGYELNAQGNWVKAKDLYNISDKDKNIDGAWYKIEDPLVESQEHYKHIVDDFKGGAACYYEWDDEAKAYKWKGDISDHKTGYLDNIHAWAKAHPGAIINGWFGKSELALAQGGQLYGLVKAAVGSLGLPGGPTLVNEQGTEAIVTPYGTLTSLPSGTGVVPADITKNLWALGEVAPAFSRLLEPMVKNGGNALGDSFTVQNMVVNMSPDGSFDVDTFVNDLKSAVALHKNS